MASIFFSYSHKDESQRDELDLHLAQLKREGLETWHDRRITGGNEFEGEIHQNLEGADIILLLISPYFLASKYCYDVEMSRALERHKNNEARVIPIILESCDWKSAPFGKLLALPKDGREVSKFANPNEAWAHIVVELRRVLEEIGASAIAPLPNPKTATRQKEGGRSSNLAVKRSFSAHEKDLFLEEAFEYVSRFFDNSLNELEKRNTSIQCRFRKSSDRFSAHVYRNGDIASERTVWLNENGWMGKAICSIGGVTNESNSVDTNIVVADNGYTLFLQPQTFTLGTPEGEEELSEQGAAEYLWSRLISPLQ